MTGPILFADETARTQLVEYGETVTFRSAERTTGDTWWRESRTGLKQGDVHVAEIEAVDPGKPDELEPYAPLSGFASVEEWQAAIRELNGELSDGFLYRVTQR